MNVRADSVLGCSLPTAKSHATDLSNPACWRRGAVEPQAEIPQVEAVAAWFGCGPGCAAPALSAIDIWCLVNAGQRLTSVANSECLGKRKQEAGLGNSKCTLFCFFAHTNTLLKAQLCVFRSLLWLLSLSLFSLRSSLQHRAVINTISRAKKKKKHTTHTKKKCP